MWRNVRACADSFFSTQTNGLLRVSSSGAMFAGTTIICLVQKPMEHAHVWSSGAMFASAPIHLLYKTNGVLTVSNSGAMFAGAPIHVLKEKHMECLHVQIMAPSSRVRRFLVYYEHP
jgi:hypothetical protein